MSVKHIREDQFDSEVLSANGRVLVDFYADWCGPCKTLAPVLEEVSNEVEGLTVVKVNVDEAQGLAQKYGVMSIPTVYLFDGGKNAGKFVGLRSKDDIIEFLSQ